MHGLAVLVVAALFLGGCATVPEGARDPNDPFEPTNRALFEAAVDLDNAITKPLALTYRRTLPQGVRNSIRNFLNNLGSANDFANNLLQGRPDRAGATVIRAVVNTTVGIGGLFDVAQEIGVPRFYEDLGQTLAVWGVGEGAYLVVPLIGPSTARDMVGRVGDFFLDPLSYVQWGDEWYVPYVRAGVENLDLRERAIQTLEDIEAGSADYYAAVREACRQARNNQIGDGETNIEDLPDF
jgi:phospholipid-binding lipoprotein MlaA